MNQGDFVRGCVALAQAAPTGFQAKEGAVVFTDHSGALKVLCVPSTLDMARSIPPLSGQQVAEVLADLINTACRGLRK